MIGNLSGWQLAAMLLAAAGVLFVAWYLVVRLAWALIVNAIALTMKPGLRHYHANLRSWRWQTLRRYVIWRDFRRCRVCRRRGQLDVHHVRPVSKGGSWFTKNLIAVHRSCHAGLHGRLPW